MNSYQINNEIKISKQCNYSKTTFLLYSNCTVITITLH